MSLTAATGPTPAQLDACVSCGLCLPHCPTFRLTGDEIASPRGRIAAMSALAEGLVQIDDTYEEIMSLCLQCRACEAVCPSLVPFGPMMERTRARIAVERPTRMRWARRLLVGRALSMRWLLALVTAVVALLQRVGVTRWLPGRLGRIRGLRRQRVFPRSVIGVHDVAPAEPARSVALLAGCVMDPWFPEVHDATREVLQLAGFEVDVPETQGCCGALAAHEGAIDDARRMAARNVGAFSRYEYVIANAAGCSAHLKDYGHWSVDGRDLADRTRDVTEFVAELIAAGRLPRTVRHRGEVAVQDPCHLRHAQRIVDAPRDILRAAGYVPIEIDPDGICCGAAGLYAVFEAGTADVLGLRKAEQVRDAGPVIVASANPGCEIQLRYHLGGAFEVVHPIELYWRALLEEAD